MSEVTETDVKPEDEQEEISLVEKLTKERDELQDQLLRALADFQNYRKRTQAEMETFRQFAAEDLVLKLLPILDNFERTLEAYEKGASAESLLEGIKAIDRQFRSVLEAKNVAKIKAHMEQFDPELHDAIAAEVTDEHEEGTVLQELESGYKMANKVIRPARVRVSKKP
ncbi:MAG: nucleotide exchange factor GrpE [Armatimonadetes bacterium]|nr:nucleotide exchange factor GrpE [Armatimonadota bacterium]